MTASAVSIVVEGELANETSNYDTKTKPTDTGRKLNIHKTFRRRSGRLLNILCTFTLRPVSMGKAYVPI